MSESDLLIRASPRTLLTFALGPVVTTFPLFIVVSAAFHRSHDGLALAVAVAYWLIHFPFLFRARARFTRAGIEAQNAFRSFSAPWEEIRAIRVVPGLWYSYDTSWTRMLEVETKSGQCFTLRCCTKLRRPTLEKLKQLLQERAAEYGFTVPDNLEPIWKVNWAEGRHP